MTEKALEFDPKKMEDVEYNYAQIEENISLAAQQAGKSREDIIFLAATKTVEPVYINRAIACGLKYIGENRVQELLAKYDDYDLANASLHFIGHLQSNKIRQIVGKVDLIQSVDSIKLAKEISRQGQLKNTSTDVLVEVNIGGEENKSGVEPERLEELLSEISVLDNVLVKGLMTIPPVCNKKSEVRKYFSRMNKLFIDIKEKKLDNISMEFLSMGMSSDYQEAILEGANMVRVGSALFGPRIYV